MLENNKLFISKDYGNTFEEVYTFHSKIQGIYVSDMNSLFISVSPNRWEKSKKSTLYRSIDLKNFEKVLTIKSGAILNWNFASIDNNVFVSEYGYKSLPDNARRIYKSSDDGKTWHVIYKPKEKLGYHNHKIVIDKKTKTIYQVYGDISKGILKSEDLGKSFHTIKENIHPTSALLIDNDLYWGLDNSPFSGVIKHNIKTDSFENIFESPSDLNGSIYDMVKIDDKIFIFLSSYDFQKWDGSIFYTEDFGETWHEFIRIPFIPDIGVAFFNASVDDQYMYVSGSIPMKEDNDQYKKYSTTLRFKIK